MPAISNLDNAELGNDRRADHTGTNPGSRVTFAKTLIFVVLARVLLATLVWQAYGWSGFIHDDTASYVDSARSLLHGEFSRDGEPEIFRTPGYPAALIPSVLFRNFELPALLENFLFTALGVWLVYRIANELLPGSHAAIWAAALYGFEPLSLLNSEKLITEPLFTAQLLLFVWLMTRFLRKPTYRTLLLAALAAGAATYTRPVLTFLALWLTPLLVFFPRTLTLRQRLASAIVFPLVFGVSLTPWLLRNHFVAGYPGFATVSDYNLYFCSAAAVEAKVDHVSFAELNDARQYLQRHPEQRTWTPAQISIFQTKSAQRVLSQHAFSYIPIHLKGSLVVLFDPGIAEVKLLHLLPERTGLFAASQDLGLFRSMLRFIKSHRFAASVLFLLEVLLLLYYWFGLVGLRHLPLEIGLFFGMLVLYFTLACGGPCASARYRLPIMPLVCIAAAACIHQRNSTFTPTVSSTLPL